MTDQDKEVELLKFNYRNLHESIWEAHKVAWTVTGMFIPFTLALQGYIGKRYIDNDNLGFRCGNRFFSERTVERKEEAEHTCEGRMIPIWLNGENAAAETQAKVWRAELQECSGDSLRLIADSGSDQ